MTDTPIHHWTMDNISGSSVIDEIAGGENLAFVGWTQIAGKFDYGLSGSTTTTNYLQLAVFDRTNTATHAIQCQNRPATDQPWRNGMCGHTEYVVRGDR